MLATLLNPHSPQTLAISKLALVILILCAFILLLVGLLVWYASWKFRERPGAPPPPKTFGNLKFETTWTILPFLILIVVFILTVRTMHAVNPPEGDREADLVITAHQWWWEIKYLGSGVLTANEVHIPTDKKLLVRLESADVIHDFWVPTLARKIDAIPGHPNYFYLEADEPGVYHGVCAEFCGTQHAGMRIRVIAQTPEAFQNWKKAQLVIPPRPITDPAARGAALFASKTCYNCHTISGTGSTQEIGPDLTHVASRQTLGAGVLENSPENLRAWLKNPQQYKPGSHMPNFQLQPDELQALATYLGSLK